MARKHWKALLAPLAVGMAVAALLMSAGPSRSRPVVPLGPAALQQAAFNGGARLYLRFGNVTGTPSGAQGHANDMQIAGFSWGVGRPVNGSSPGGFTLGGLSISTMDLTRAADQYSIKLLPLALSGAATASATVFVERYQGTPPTLVESLTYQLGGVFITNDSVSGAGGGSAKEALQLSFKKVTITYTVPGQTPVSTGWDQSCGKPSC